MHVIDFGSGGLDLAYEVMRGYDALILIDVSRQGEAPGTLYVMEADPDDVDGQIEDGQMLDPHGMDPQTVLRFVKYVGGWPGRVFVVACEPEVVEDVGFGLSEPVSGRSPARPTSCSRRSPSCAMHELSIATAVLNTALEHAGERPVDASSACASGACARSCPTRCGSTSRSSRATRSCEGARLELDRDRARLRCGDCGHEWEPRSRRSAARAASRPTVT